ncbi:MAG: pilus (MSHA type) biogenesis protein MshL [Candidatus Muproteobacteria bacterium RBG_16_60_9]|uniref:Pilus (MSHA type) biogenesis protein MshL n=1 Tax=Candidatus Muproteobacteria bacterium RBG_16_60_9 TaxID=1817755 RepID=A0A1F6VK63_9PROT|nr:MAG: pilus (MSHA type) biogenesis protein MshL [Candidatus Muproteobacteria bacterium RBG_16_60_9]
MRQLLFGTAVAGLLLAGCQSVPSKWNDDVRDRIDTSLDPQKKSESAALPTEVSKGLLPPLEITIPDGRKAPVEPRFDLSVSNAPARQVFMGLVEGTPYDMVLQPDVGGSVTLNLKDVTVPEALTALREAYGYEFRRDGNRYFILGRDMQTRIFRVNYLNLQRRGKSDTRVQGGEIGSRSSGTGSSGNSAATATGNSSVQIETSSQSDFWKELGDNVRAIIGSVSDRRVVVNAQAGIVVVRAMPEELRIIENYLGATHDSVNRQVVLEAKIVEVQLSDGFQAGINWSKVNSKYTFGQVGGGTAATSGASEIAGNIGNLNPTTGIFSQISGTNASAFGGIFSLAVNSGSFAAFLELLQSQGQVQVLSSPRVSTVNNQKAVIKIGGEDFFVTGVTNSATSTVGATTGPSVELTSFFSGIVLDVTPQIDEANNIVLHIHPSVSTITQKDKAFTVFGSAVTLPLASSSIQESDNIVRAQSAQIIVIGGLMREATTDDNASVPFLGDIPIVGNLFKQRKITRVKRELVILLKPTIINSGSDWGEDVKGAQERIRKIRIGA